MSSDRARMALCFALAAGWLAAPAAAQDAEPPEEADSAPSEEAPPDPRFEEARERFLQGLALADAGNCSGAIAEFDASMAILPRPNTLFNIARCQETLNRYDLAVRAYEEFLRTAPPDDPERPTVEATMRQLQNLLGTIRLQSNVPAQVWLGDRVVGEAPGAVLVPGGLHVLELRAEGRIPERREVQVTARGDVSIEVTLAAAEHHEHLTTNVSYEAPPLPIGLTVAMMGATVATLGVGIGFGVNAIQLSDQAHALDPRLPRDTSAIEESALFADIFYIAGGVLGAATIAMAFLTDWNDGARPEASSESVRVTPILGPLYAGIRVEGLE